MANGYSEGMLGLFERGGTMKILGTAILAWLIYDTLGAVATAMIAIRKMGWARMANDLKKNKKELISRIIIPLVFTLLTIYYILNALRGG